MGQRLSARRYYHHADAIVTVGQLVRYHRNVSISLFCEEAETSRGSDSIHIGLIPDDRVEFGVSE